MESAFRGSVLERILWGQLGRALYGAPPAFDPGAAAVGAIRAVLEEGELAPEELALLARWDERREPAQRFFDRLLQARIDRALRAGAQAEAARLGLEALPALPRVRLVREGGAEPEPLSVEPRLGSNGTGIDYLSGSMGDVAALPPGARLDQLVELVLADRAAAAALGKSLGPAASVMHPEEPGGEPVIDLLLAAQTPSIVVLDVERELARLEELLRLAIPAERRPPRGEGTWSFGQDLTGQRLGGKYLVRRLVGKGAFKTVYEGVDEMLGARVAIAVLNPKGARSPRALEHFQEEARKLTRLDHENIVRWITFDRTSDGLHYFVMEYLDGEELEKVLRRETRLAPKRVAEILLQVLAALRRAHAQGTRGALLHLDLKPENVFVLPPLAPGEPERVKVIDFGIGQHVGAEVRAAERPELRSIFDLPAEALGRSVGSLALPEEEQDDPPIRGDPVRRRVVRARGGTLLYASPEQCKHLAGHRDILPLDGRSDLYSLGVMAFRLLTGQFPFARTRTAHEAIRNHLEAPPRRVGSLGVRVPRALAAFVDRCLAKDRDGRWRDAGEAYEALERIVHPRFSPARVALPVGFLLALGVGALYYGRAPVVNPLALVDPAIADVAGRVQEELFLGPRRATRALALESEVGWGAQRPDLGLRDASDGSALSGWGVRWLEEAGNAIELGCLPGARSARAVLVLEGTGRARWRSPPLTLHHLGAWTIERAAVAGADPARALDPRGRRLELELGGDAEGRAALAAIELWNGDELVARVRAGEPVAEGATSVRYEGPELDALDAERARALTLRVVARDRAGQEEQSALALFLAGPPADFGPRTGFVARAEAGAPLLESAGEVLLLSGRALSLEATKPARVRLFVDPFTRLPVERSIQDPARPLVVPVAELGIDGPGELAGVLRIELDDAPWVDRVAPVVRERRLPFRYTPAAPSLEVRLIGVERALVEAGAGEAVNHLDVPAAASLVVRSPPGVNLWIEAALRGPGSSGGPPRRLSRSSGAHELPLELAEEGLYELRVQAYLLLAGDQRGPALPDEQRFLLGVDRTAPELHLALEGHPGSEDAEPLIVADCARIVASVREDELAELRWRLRSPGGSYAEGELAPAAEVALPLLPEHQTAEGRYELELVAADRAGNVGRVARAWQVARDGPELQLVEPVRAGAEPRWVLGAERSLQVRVRARDANGVAAVRLRLFPRGEPGPELELRPAAGELWELAEEHRPRVFPWWATRELALELTAIDGAGLARSLREQALVPEVPGARTLVIAPRERQDERMVTVDVDGEYVFGGRTGEGPRPWSVPIPRAALRPFFLDAREVTRAEFLAFLRSPDFEDPRRWPGGAPDAERRARLQAACATEPASPATGIAWPEAAAYAAWRGKRLPTLVEWEFAVRGHEYRTAPPAAAPGAPLGWPESLCAGPREWTSTPDPLVEAALDFASQCRRHWELLLPDASRAVPEPGQAGFHWVAGPGPREPGTWQARAALPDSPGQDDVGFRCAMDRAAAHVLLERGDYVLVE